MLADLVGILRSHQLYLPPDLALFIKAFVSLEGMGRDLDPDLDLAGEAVPMLREALLTRYAPAALAKRGWHAASEISKLMSDLPRDISQLLRSARRGRLEIHIDVGHLKHVGDQLDLATNRLIIGIIVASIIVGSSVVMTVSGGPTLFGLPFFGLLGFVFAIDRRGVADRFNLAKQQGGSGAEVLNDSGINPCQLDSRLSRNHRDPATWKSSSALYVRKNCRLDKRQVRLISSGFKSDQGMR